MTEAIMFIYEYPAEEYPRPAPNHVREVHMDDMSDMGVRMCLVVVKKAIKLLGENPDFTKVDWNENQIMTTMTMFEKKIDVDNANTMWVTVRRPGAVNAYGFWISPVSIQKL